MGVERPNCTDAGDGAPTMREAGVAAVTDRRELISMAWSDRDVAVRCAAIDRLHDDQPLLLDLARTAGEPLARLAAIRGLTDRLALNTLALKDGTPSVRLAAMLRLLTLVEPWVSKALLGAVAARDPDGSVRQAALDHLEDGVMLREIAERSDLGPEVRLGAVRALKSEEDLYRVAETNPHADLRLAAAERIATQARLLALARGAPQAEVRRAATSKLTDQESLKWLAVNDPSAEVRRAAVERIEGQAELEAIAYFDEDAGVRMLAIDRIVNRSALVDIARGLDEPDVRARALARLSVLGPDLPAPGVPCLLAQPRESGPER